MFSKYLTVFCLIFMLTFVKQHVSAEFVQEHKLGSEEGYVRMFLCVIEKGPWSCLQERTGRILDAWDKALEDAKRDFKVEADQEVAKNPEGRKISEKPSTITGHIEAALGEVTEMVSSGVESLLGRKKGGDKPSSSGGHGGGHGGGHDKPDHGYDDHDAIHLNLGHEGGHGGHGGGHGGLTHGRAVGVKRGKKKKKKKALMKLFLLGAVLKAKIGLLLQLLSAHLQIKFFAIAVIGLLINIARFWIDLKQKHQPQKVIYYEHAQHQHHYDDHGDESYGSYWKRSLDEVNAHELAYNAQQAAAEEQAAKI